MMNTDGHFARYAAGTVRIPRRLRDLESVVIRLALTLIATTSIGVQCFPIVVCLDISTFFCFLINFRLVYSPLGGFQVAAGLRVFHLLFVVSNRKGVRDGATLGSPPLSAYSSAVYPTPTSARSICLVILALEYEGNVEGR